MRIAYFGGDIFYLCLKYLLETNHQVVSLHTMPETVAEYDMTQRVCMLAREWSIPVSRSKPTHEDITALESLGCEMVISAGYSYKIPSIKKTKIPYAINIHPSLLPVGAGPLPLLCAILHEQSETGTTLHKLSDEWDAGDILLQKRIDMGAEETLESLYIKSYSQVVLMLKDFLSNPESFWNCAQAQDLSKRVFWKQPEAGSLLINFNQPVEVVTKYLRLHRYVSLEGIVEYITNISSVLTHHDIAPGTTVSQSEDHLCVAVQDGYVSFNLKKKPVDYYDALVPIHTT